jgi:hypothetical protein
MVLEGIPSMNKKKLFKNSNVTLIGRGYKRKNGKIVYKYGKPVEAIIIGVAEKKPLSALTKKEIIPRKIRKGFLRLRSDPVDVVQTGIIRAMPPLPKKPKSIPEYQTKVRPICPGISCGHYAITAGTIGPVVTATEMAYVPTARKAIPQDHAGFWEFIWNLIRRLFGLGNITEPPTPEPPPEPEPNPEPPDEDDNEGGCPDVANAKDCEGCPDWLPDVQDCWWEVDCPDTPNQEDCNRCDDWIDGKCQWELPGNGGTEGPFEDTTGNGVGNIPGTKKIGFVTNNHVGANSTVNGQGAKKGDPCLQQGPYDGGNVGSETCGKLHTVIPLYTGIKNLVDACFIEATVDIIDKVFGINYAPKTIVPMEEIQLGMEVVKQGRTTGIRYGYIDMLDVEVPVWYDNDIIDFQKQIVIKTNDNESFSEGGDSGSLILTMDGRALGLLYAGGDDDTIINPMYNVQTEFLKYGIKIELGIN